MATFTQYITIGLSGQDYCNCILEIVPNIKRLSGTTRVTIKLNADSPKVFTGATGVTFGGVAGTNMTVDAVRTITVDAPAGTASTQVDVVVTLVDATTVTASKGFWYPDWASLSNVLAADTNDGNAGTSDKLYSAAEELARNKFNTGTTVADLKLGKSVKLQNVDNEGTYEPPSTTAKLLILKTEV